MAHSFVRDCSYKPDLVLAWWGKVRHRVRVIAKLKRIAELASASASGSAAAASSSWASSSAAAVVAGGGTKQRIEVADV